MGGCHEYFSAHVFVTEAACILKATLEEKMSANCRSWTVFQCPCPPHLVKFCINYSEKPLEKAKLTIQREL